MLLEGKVPFTAAPQHVWEVLRDPGALQQAIPGCEKLEEVSHGTYKADLKLGIAAIRGNYTAEVRIAEERAPAHYRLEISGQGAPGFVNVAGDVDLAPDGEQTQVTYKFDAQVGGVVAAVGQRMLTGVARMLVGDFFKAMQRAAG